MSDDFDRDAFAALSDEFGGLAGWYVKKHDGQWTQEAWEDAMVKLYEQREHLDGVRDSKRRGKIALDAFSSVSPEEQLDRIEAKLRARQPATSTDRCNSRFDELRSEVENA
jgi:hypothetical protein